MLADVDAAPIDPKLRAALKLLRKVTKDHAALTAGDMREVLDAGVTNQQILDALMVGFCFNVITRLADTFQFYVGPRSHFEAGAKHLLTRGYK